MNVLRASCIIYTRAHTHVLCSAVCVRVCVCGCVLCNFNAFEVKLLNASTHEANAMSRPATPRPATPRHASSPLPRLHQIIWQVSFVSHGEANAASERACIEEAASHCCPLTPESMQRWAKPTKMAANKTQTQNAFNINVQCL